MWGNIANLRSLCLRDPIVANHNDLGGIACCEEWEPSKMNAEEKLPPVEEEEVLSSDDDAPAVDDLQEEEGGHGHPPPPEVDLQGGSLVALRPPGFRVVWDSMD